MGLWCVRASTLPKGKKMGSNITTKGQVLHICDMWTDHAELHIKEYTPSISVIKYKKVYFQLTVTVFYCNQQGEHCCAEYSYFNHRNAMLSYTLQEDYVANAL